MPLIYDKLKLTKPTLLLDEAQTRRNIDMMANKAKRSGVRLRPHFKTHQSARIGEWFREAGVTSITVSSVDMALYFADHGWSDITIAIPVNTRDVERLNQLARRVSLHLVVESIEAVAFLNLHLQHEAGIWLKIDTGYHRAGLLWSDETAISQVALEVHRSPRLALRGLLSHAGHTYKTKQLAEIREIYRDTMSRLHRVRDRLAQDISESLAISVGDTPSCTIVENFRGVDEIRPGNFVFFDVMQLQSGVCSVEQISIAVACPVIARHPERQELLLYGGAVHLSRDFLIREEGGLLFGLVAQATETGWGDLLPNTYLKSLSQEHGVVKTTMAMIDTIAVGDMLLILPVHSCLTANLMGVYTTLQGDRFGTAVRSI